MGVYCDVLETESPDNRRFLSDVEKWVGLPLTIIKSSKYDTIDDVFEARKYMSGPKGAPCTVEMKKVPRFNFQEADDIHIFGLTYDEPLRIEKFESHNPDLYLNWILINNEMTKEGCLNTVQAAGIKLPIRYEQGFSNNNCICCVKATSINYWVLERRTNPEIFKRRAEQSRRLGVRLCRYNGKRIFLDEIPPDEQILFYGKPLKIMRSVENLSCGPECGG